MKKALLYCLVPIFFFSCKKDNQSGSPVTTGQKKYPVTYNVSGFQQVVLGAAKTKQTVGALNASVAPATTGENLVLHYLVYDSDGTLVRNIAEPSDSTSFSTIKDSLAAGTYSVYFIAGGSDINIGSGYGPGLSVFSYPVWEDTFTNHMTLTVTGGSLNENVTLKRIVAELEVDLNSQIPQEAKTLEIKVNKDYVYADLDGTIDTSQVISPSKIFQMVPGTKTFDLLMLNTISSFNVEITAYDASKNMIAHATVNNVKCTVNTRTILTGALFGSQNNTFTVSLNDQWVPVPYKTINF